MTDSDGIARIGGYQDGVHAEDLDGVVLGEHGYKVRTIDGLPLPPFVTPARYQVSRAMVTRPDDVAFCSYPSSGSTWLAHVLYLILHGGEVPEKETLQGSLHWMESSWPHPRNFEDVDGLASPRIFKGHMPYRMALGGGPERSPCKHLYIARNPKDVCVSYYHFERGKAWTGGYDGPWDHWLRMFVEGKVQRGDWFEHVLSWWRHRDAPNLLFLRYEDLKHDFDGQVARIASFLGRDLPEEVARKIRAAASFEKMRSAPFTSLREVEEFGGFFRKGEIGSWKEQFTVAQNEAFDRLYRERMEGTGLDFDFV